MLRRNFPSTSSVALLGSVSRRFFSSTSLNQPPGVSGDDLLANIKSSHQATSGLRFAETQRRQDEELMKQQNQKYRDGLVNPASGSATYAGRDAHVKSFVGDDLNNNNSDNNSHKEKSAQTGSSSLHFDAPSNPLTIGRDPLILSLWQSILSGRRALFLTGGDGMGASTVASQFAEHARRSGRFSCIQWFDCSRTVSNASDEIAGTSIREPAVEQLKQFVKQMRHRNEDEVLLIFDHPENPVEILKALHATFVAMKQQQQQQKSGDHHQDNNQQQQQQFSTPQEAANPAQYLFSGPAKLSDGDLRAHYSRLHLLFVTPQKLNPEKSKIVNPIDELLKVSVSASHRERNEEEGKVLKDDGNNAVHTLASEFCPAVFHVDPVDETPAMLLVERLIQNNISEYYQNQLALDSNLQHKTEKSNIENTDGSSSSSSSLLPPPPPALFDTHLLALCDRVARVPLLLVLASEYVAAELMTSSRMKDLTTAGEVLVGEEEEALFQEIIDQKLTQKILAPTMKNKTEENPEGSLSISAAAAGLCLATVRSILASSCSPSSSSSNIIITSNFVEKLIFSLASLNISDLSHELVEGLIVESAKEIPNSALGSFLTASSSNREQVVSEVELLLRRCGLLSDSLVFNEFATKSKIVKNTNNSIEEEVYVCHVALADGLLLLSSSMNNNNQNDFVYRTLLNMFVKAKARNDFFAQMRVARHVEAMLLSSKNNNSNQNNNSSNSSTREILFDRVATFLVNSNNTTSGDLASNPQQAEFVRKMWLMSFNHFSSSSSVEDKETAARIGLDLGRLLLAQNNNRMKEIEKLQQQNSNSDANTLKNLQEKESAEYDFIANLLEKSSELSLASVYNNKNNNHNDRLNFEQIVASKNVVWAEITSLRARMMDPEKKETIEMFSAAAQIIENYLGSSTSSAITSSSLLLLKQEYFLLLVAWAKSAEYLGKEVPEQHWAKIKKMSDSLKQNK